jgi:hypothetical protein
MKERSTKKTPEPSAKSLREMPEVDLARLRVVGRGRQVARAKRSLEMVAIDKKIVDQLGGPDALVAILEALVKSLHATRATRRKGRAA